ncbi:unnamed protein product [Urochloa humidicola]
MNIRRAACAPPSRCPDPVHAGAVATFADASCPRRPPAASPTLAVSCRHGCVLPPCAAAAGPAPQAPRPGPRRPRSRRWRPGARTSAGAPSHRCAPAPPPIGSGGDHAPCSRLPPCRCRRPRRLAPRRIRHGVAKIRGPPAPRCRLAAARLPPSSSPAVLRFLTRRIRWPHRPAAPLRPAPP